MIKKKLAIAVSALCLVSITANANNNITLPAEKVIHPPKIETETNDERKMENAGCSPVVHKALVAQSEQKILTAYHATIQNTDKAIKNLITTQDSFGAGFEGLGCDMSGSLGTIASLYKNLKTMFTTMQSGDYMSAMWSNIQDKAQDLAMSYAQKALDNACQKVNNKIKDAWGGLPTGTLEDISRGNIPLDSVVKNIDGGKALNDFVNDVVKDAMRTAEANNRNIANAPSAQTTSTPNN